MSVLNSVIAIREHFIGHFLHAARLGYEADALFIIWGRRANPVAWSLIPNHTPNTDIKRIFRYEGYEKDMRELSNTMLESEIEYQPGYRKH